MLLRTFFSWTSLQQSSRIRIVNKGDSPRLWPNPWACVNTRRLRACITKHTLERRVTLGSCGICLIDCPRIHFNQDGHNQNCFQRSNSFLPLGQVNHITKPALCPCSYWRSNNVCEFKSHHGHHLDMVCEWPYLKENAGGSSPAHLPIFLFLNSIATHLSEPLNFWWATVNGRQGCGGDYSWYPKHKW